MNIYLAYQLAQLIKLLEIPNRKSIQINGLVQREINPWTLSTICSLKVICKHHNQKYIWNKQKALLT